MKRRTVLAAILTAAAMLLPGAAWYLGGSREAARQADALRQEPRRRAREAGLDLAQKVRERLEALRREESRRPYYHYQSLYHDPRGVSSGLSLVPSPLSDGPLDPLIQVHFQVDAQGRVTAPGSGQAARVRGELKEAAPLFRQRIAALDTARPRPSPRADPPPQVQTLEPGVYAQNQMANVIDRARAAAQRRLPAVPVTSGATPVIIRLGALEWQGLPGPAAAAPVAVREVVTPDGAVLQGFTLSAAALDELLRAAAFPARFRRGPPPRPWDAGLSLDGTAWHVSLDLGGAEAAAAQRAAQVLRSFRRSALAMGLAAALAGAALVALVWQSERLASQRAHLAAAAAHELRTPLTGLRLYGEMLADALGDPARQKDYAQRIAGESARLGRVVTNLLGFTRLEHGRLAVEPRAGDLAQAVRQDVSRQEPGLAAAGARVSLEIAPDLPPVRFDPDAVSQILQNLLDNAEKYSRGAADRTLRVRLEHGGGRATLSVADQGPGIPPAVARRLFRPFERATTNGAPQGLGLGLALVQALTRAHGGSATIDAAPGGGARVTVSLPLAAS